MNTHTERCQMLDDIVQYFRNPKPETALINDLVALAAKIRSITSHSAVVATQQGNHYRSQLNDLMVGKNIVKNIVVS